ncbi:MAG: hypothetical protein K2W99_01295 [Chthoniobacterales bacterium]|nr:hypothetical protein [Chthoniobacterales bacterium]
MPSFLFFFITLFFTCSSLFSQENNANTHAPLAKATSVTLDLPETTVEALFAPVFLGQEKQFVLSTRIMSPLPARSDHEQANEWAFAGILEDGSIYAWGDKAKGGASPHLPKNQEGIPKCAKSIFSNVWSFVAMLEDGSLWEWGCFSLSDKPIDRAVSLPYGKKATCCLASTASAFAVVLDDYSLFAWGVNPSAKKAPPLPKDETGKPKKPCCLYSNQETFTVVFSDKTLLAWGNLNGGGENDHKTVSLPTGKKLLSCCSLAVAENAFAAILEDHSLFVWGKWANDFPSKFYAPKIPVGKTPIKVIAGDGNFTLLLENEQHDQSFLSWGRNFSGEEVKLPPGRKIKAECCVVATIDSFATILDNGAIFAWGNNPLSGGDFRDQPQDRTGKMLEACCLVANDQAFSASLKDGSIMTWGNYWYGGTFWYNHGNIFPSEEETSFYATSAIAHCLVANHGAFSAFLEDGSALAWGSSFYGGNMTQEDSWAWWPSHNVAVRLYARSINPQYRASITSLVSNGSAFAAITDQGSLLKWGASSYGGGYDEELFSKDLPRKQKLKTIATPLKKQDYYKEDKLAGIALIENKTTSEQGEWQYASACVPEWKAVPSGLTETHAFCLPAATKLRFVPTANFVGEVAPLQAKLLSVRAPCFRMDSMMGSMAGSMANNSMPDSMMEMSMEMGNCFIDLTQQAYVDSCSPTSIALTGK